MATPANYQEFNQRLNVLINELVSQRGEIAFYVAHQSWFAASGVTALKAQFNSMVAAAKPELDDLNAFVQAA